MSTYVNAISLPAAAVPVGRTPDGLPIGLQVIGRRYREMEVLAIAKELEEGFGGWIEPDLAQAATSGG
jgi:Asp-tRNA(Asn)/Glu-tRNA(Gln) amidotransferase A subunit family amidase